MYYHGTNEDKDFQDLMPNNLNLIWVTPDYDAAKKYARTYYKKGQARIFHVKVSGTIIDFSDNSNPEIQEIIQLIKSNYLFDIEKNWSENAGFGIIESNSWIIDFLIEKGYSAIKCLDSNGTYNHSSVAIISKDYTIEDIEILND